MIFNKSVHNNMVIRDNNKIVLYARDILNKKILYNT